LIAGVSINAYMFGRHEYLKMDMCYPTTTYNGTVLFDGQRVLLNSKQVDGKLFNRLTLGRQFAVVDNDYDNWLNTTRTEEHNHDNTKNEKPNKINFYEVQNVPSCERFALAFVPNDAQVEANSLQLETNKIIVGPFFESYTHPAINEFKGYIQAKLIIRNPKTYDNINNPTFDASLIFTNCGRYNMEKVKSKNPLHYMILSLYIPYWIEEYMSTFNFCLSK